MKMYCTTCGSATDYSTSKPKFCQACAAPFAGALPAQKPAKTLATIKPLNVVETDDDDDDDSEPVTEVPQIEGLAVDVSAPIKRGQKLGEFAGTVEQADSFKREMPKVSKKKVLAEFRKEAGTLRPKK